VSGPQRPSQWDAIGLLDGGWDGALVVGWTLALLGSPARQGGVGHDRERDEQDRQRHQGVAPAAGLDEPAGQGDIDDAGEPGDYGEGQQGPGPLGSVTKPGGDDGKGRLVQHSGHDHPMPTQMP
jgi:hypothetical protein